MKHPKLDTDGFVVWKIQLSASSAVGVSAAVLLSEEERQCASQLKFEYDKQCYLRSHIALRLLLADQLETDPAALTFATGPWGKPCLVSKHAANDLHFSMSRTQEAAFIGIARGQEIGVDTEAVREIHALDDIIARDFTSCEREALNTVRGRVRNLKFLKMWTAKEAGLKAVGVGLSCPPAHAPLILNASRRVIGIDLECARSGAGKWSVVHLPAGPGYVAAAASARIIVPHLKVGRFEGDTMKVLSV